MGEGNMEHGERVDEGGREDHVEHEEGGGGRECGWPRWGTCGLSEGR
jgi:hypothetical protein